MSAASLSPRTVNKYVEYIMQVVKSLKAPNGEPVHKRTWDAETMDLPIVSHSEQKRPSLKAKPISTLIADSTGQEQALYECRNRLCLERRSLLLRVTHKAKPISTLIADSTGQEQALSVE